MVLSSRTGASSSIENFVSARVRMFSLRDLYIEIIRYKWPNVYRINSIWWWDAVKKLILDISKVFYEHISINKKKHPKVLIFFIEIYRLTFTVFVPT